MTYAMCKTQFSATTACSDGDILLYNGTTLSANHSSGTVLVCYDNEYGTVCDDFWDTLDATVVCTWLGFNPSGIIYCLLCTCTIVFDLTYMYCMILLLIHTWLVCCI